MEKHRFGCSKTSCCGEHFDSRGIKRYGITVSLKMFHKTYNWLSQMTATQFILCCGPTPTKLKGYSHSTIRCLLWNPTFSTTQTGWPFKGSFNLYFEQIREMVPSTFNDFPWCYALPARSMTCTVSYHSVMPTENENNQSWRPSVYVSFGITDLLLVHMMTFHQLCRLHDVGCEEDFESCNEKIRDCFLGLLQGNIIEFSCRNWGKPWTLPSP
jgi:hypothetical protein